jgi:hypothetical protein
VAGDWVRHERTGGASLAKLDWAGRAIRNAAHVFVTIGQVMGARSGRGDETRMPTGADLIYNLRPEFGTSGLTLFYICDGRQIELTLSRGTAIAACRTAHQRGWAYLPGAKT